MLEQFIHDIYLLIIKQLVNSPMVVMTKN